MADFSVESKFNPQANFQSVKFGADTNLLEVELNEMQQIQTEARAELVRQATPSGFISLSELDYAYMAANPNTIRFLNDSIAFVHGYQVTIPAGTIMPLSAPPTEGSREDLAFLEVWIEEVDYTKPINKYGGDGQGTIPNTLKDDRIGVETSRRIQLKCRLRTIDDVDFSMYDLDGMSTSGYWWRDDHKILAQGGNSEPLKYTAGLDTLYQCYRHSNLSFQDIKVFGDRGLFVVGKGNQASKDTLKTADGYVYAIPLFRVSRRNSGGYSVNNGNGSDFLNSLIVSTKLPNWASNVGSTNVVSLNITSQLLANFSVGDVVRIYGTGGVSTTNTTYAVLKVTDIDTSAKTITLLTLIPSSIQYGTLVSSKLRKDYMYADIIAERDVKPLWHQISLTGFSAQQLLEENFDKLLRGELQTKEKMQMVKTYHGVRKTPIDSNTIFYASMDGSINAEVGGAPVATLGTSFASSITGNGIKGAARYTFELIDSLAYTIDSIIYIPANLKTPYRPLIRAQMFDSVTHRLFSLETAETADLLQLHITDVDNIRFNTPKVGFHHFRIIRSKTKLAIYVDGVLTANRTIKLAEFLPRTYDIITNGSLVYPSTMYVEQPDVIVSDVSISNIDRGDNFATLPQDFVDGYARIAPAFNSQRKVFSDALTSQYTTDIVKASGTNVKQITATQKTPGVWTAGDTIKVRGLASEIISGVIDSDTALATITSTSSSDKLGVDDVSKIVVNDTINLLSDSGELISVVVTAVDVTNKLITINRSPFNDSWVGHTIFETTASSSSPTVKFNNAGTITAVTGTWSGLGTNEATFTLTATTGLNAQDIQIEYSLNMTAGQGGISEVLTATLAGEYQGKKLVVNPSVHVRDDFAGKKAGSVVECPHVMKYKTDSSSLLSPTSSLFVEVNQAGYDYSRTLDGIVASYMIRIAGAVPQLLLQYNIIREVEDRFGPIPALDKLQWCKDNIANISCIAYACGSCPTGNKITLKTWYTNNPAWSDDVWGTTCKNDSATPARLLSNGATPANIMDTNGMVSLVLYTDPAKTTDGYVLALSNHGLSVGDIVKDTTKGDIIQQIYYNTKDSIAVSNPSSSVTAGDSINKYHSIDRKTAEAGTNSNTLIISNHGLSTGDCIGNNTTGNIRVVTVVDANTLTVSSPVTNQASGNSISLLKFVGTQIAEDTVIPSQINLDYAYLDITLKTPQGYDVLALENPRRDDGRSNMLLVRKETKEVQTMFPAKNDDGVVTYGDHVPYQGLSRIDNGRYKVLAVSRGMITTNGTGKAYTVTKDYPLPVISQLPTNNLDSELSSEPIDTVYTATTSARVITYMINDLILESAGDNLWSGVSKPVANRYIGLSGVKQAYRGLLRGASNVLNSIACDLLKPATHKCFASVLIILDSELVLLVYGSTLRNGTINFFDMDTLDIFKLSNRPLIK